MKKIEHKFKKDIECKKCGHCKKWLSLNNFYTDKNTWDNLYSQCKKCQRQSQEKYKKNNPEKVKQSREKWARNNPGKALLAIKKWRKANIDRVKISKKIWRKSNPEGDKRRNNKYAKQPALYDSYASQLSFVENVNRGQNGELVVLCAYCGRKYIPSNSEARQRIHALNSVNGTECRFYCSKSCKHSCPIYNRSKWPKGFKQATSREVVPLLRQIVLERDNYTCQKCGATTETAQLHVHHIISYAQNKMQANDPDSCITFCKKCHEEIHQQDGCKTSDLKCNKDIQQ